MSIIYDALKKTQKNISTVSETPTAKTTKKPKKKTPLLVLMALIFAASILYVTGPLKKISRSKKQPNYARKGSLAKRITQKPITKRGPKESYTLSGIVYSHDKQFAIINGKAVSVGDTLNQARVTQIKENSVVLSFPDKKIQLTME